MARLKLPANSTDTSAKTNAGQTYAVRDGHVDVTSAEDIAELKGRGFTDASANPQPANRTNPQDNRTPR